MRTRQDLQPTPGTPVAAPATTERARPAFLLVAMPLWDVDTPPLTLAYVSALVRSADWDCRVADVNVSAYHMAEAEDRQVWDDPAFYLRPLQEQEVFYRRFAPRLEALLTQLVQSDEYALVGFSVTQQSRFFTLRAARFLAEQKPELPILLGGSDCFVREFGRRYFDGSDRTPNLLLQGEAEIALPAFLREYAATRRPVTTMPGFVFRRGFQLVDTGEPALPDLKTQGVVADYSQFDFNQYRNPRLVSSFFTRGCINRCAFCNERNHFRRFRVRNPEQVVAEISGAVALLPGSHAGTPAFVRLNDSIFNGSRKDVERLCDALEAANLEIWWGVQVSFSVPFDQALLARLHRAGCRTFFWGFESASQSVLDRMGKNFRLEEAKRIVLEAQALEIENYLPLLVGFPGEGPTDVFADLLFVLEFRHQPRVHFPYVSQIEIKENSDLHTRYAAFGVADPNAHGWYTRDGRNTRDVRVFRMWLLGNASGDWETQAYGDLIATVDFNHPAVASEVAAMLLLLGANCGSLAAAVEFLQAWDAAPLPDFDPHSILDWRPAAAPETIRWEAWFGRDKNAPETKRRILQRLLAGIRDLSRSRGWE